MEYQGKFLNKRNKANWYYECKIHFNYRLNDIQSALGISQLKKLTNGYCIEIN